MERRRQLVAGATRALPSPDALLSLPRRRFDEHEARLTRAFDNNNAQKRQAFSAIRLSPSMLKRAMREKQQLTIGLSQRLRPALLQKISGNRQSFARSAQSLRDDFIKTAQQKLKLAEFGLSPRIIMRQIAQSRTALKRADDGLLKNFDGYA